MADGSFDPVVAIETSTRRASIALRREGQDYQQVLEHERAHASDLVPTLDALFRRAGLAPGTPLPGGAVVVGIGPGSYTGLRVGIATALGLVRALDLTLRGVPSLEALAYGSIAPDEEATVILNARASEFYVARYRRTEGDVEVLLEPSVQRAKDVLVFADEAQVLIADESVAKAAGFSDELAAKVRTDVVPKAEALLELGVKRLIELGGQEAAEVDALYLRPFTSPSRR